MIAAGVGLMPGEAEGGSIVLGHKLSAQAREREDARDLALYHRLLDQRSHDPAGFDHRQPVIGQTLSNLPSFWYWFDRWQKAPARFEHWHHRFWHVLDGEAQAILPMIPSAPPPSLKPPAGQFVDLTPPSSPQGPGGPREDSPPPNIIPEPSSLVLLAVSVGLLALVRGGCRFFLGGRKGGESLVLVEVEFRGVVSGLGPSRVSLGWGL
jgi:hypothetical protein